MINEYYNYGFIQVTVEKTQYLSFLHRQNYDGLGQVIGEGGGLSVWCGGGLPMWDGIHIRRGKLRVGRGDVLHLKVDVLERANNSTWLP